MASLSQDERKRLIALLGMLGSEHDGEVAAAARLTMKFLKTRGMTWTDIVITAKIDPDDIVNYAQSFKVKPADDKSAGILAKAMALHLYTRHKDEMDASEKVLVRGLLTNDYPTDTQLNWLKALYRKYVK
jgi:hypothetical protein